MDGKRLFAVDAVALAAYLAAATPALTGVAVHEWLGIGVLVVFLVHVVQHAGWVADAVRGSIRNPSLARTGNLALDALVLVVFMVVTVSGVLISGAVLPMFGLYADGYYFWDPLHAIAAKALLALLLVHVVVHWRWIRGFFAKRGPGARAGRASAEEPGAEEADDRA